MQELSLVSAGGLNDVGHNCFIYRSGNSAVVVDCGIKPLPHSNWTYNPPTRLDILDEMLRDKVKIVGVITHAHLDHIGAVKELVSRNIPVYLSRESMPFIGRYDSLEIPQGTKFNIYNKNQTIKNGDLEISFFPVQHSIPGTHTVLIECGGKSILHWGDFKMNGMENSLEKSREILQEIKSRAGKINCLLLDVLNVEIEGFTPREQLVLDSIENIVKEAKGRVIITFFSSNIQRMAGILKIARQLHRTVGVCGRNMADSYFQLTGRLPSKYGSIILLSGSQGEENSGLVRIAHGEHRFLRFSSRDTVIFSSRCIPNNEEAIEKPIEDLHAIGASVVLHHGESKKLKLSFSPQEAITHFSGHGYRGDQRDVVEKLDPEMIIPFHAPAEKRELFKEVIGGGKTQLLRVGETLKF